MPEQFGLIKPPRSLKDPDNWGSPGTKKNMYGNVLTCADVGKFKVNEKYDIENSGVKGDTQSHQFKREYKREVSLINFKHAGEAANNPCLRSNHVQPGDPVVNTKSKDITQGLPTWAPSVKNMQGIGEKARKYASPAMGKVERNVQFEA